MRREISIVALFLVVVIAAAFDLGKHMGRAAYFGAICAPVEIPPVTVNEDWRRCLDVRHKEQLQYITWRGKHSRDLEACTASLGEATRALVHRPGKSQ